MAVAALATIAAALSGALGGDPPVVLLPAATGARDASAALTVGLLVLAAAVLPGVGGSSRGLSGSQLSAVRAACAAAAAWVATGLLTGFLTSAERSGRSAWTEEGAHDLHRFMTGDNLERAQGAAFVLAVIVCLGAAAARSIAACGLLAVLAGIAVVPLAVAGHGAGGSDHATAVTAQAGHLIGASVWTGGLLGVLLLRGELGESFAVILRRYSRLAAWSFAVVVGTGVISAATRLGGWSGLRSDYGSLLIAKAMVAVALGLIGLQLRRRVIGGERDSGVLVRLVGLELTMIAFAVGLAVALSREPAPRSGDEAQFGPLGEAMPPPFTVTRLFTEWRVDLLWMSVAVLAVVWYLRAAWALRARGDGWPVVRTAAWLGGWLVMVWATSAGPAAYGRVLFSAHMIQHMTIAMLVPILLVLAAPATLALRVLPARAGSTGPREWLLLVLHSPVLRVLANPIVAAAMSVGSLAVFYNSPLFEWALRHHSGHVLMTVHFLAAGYLFAWVICGIDPGPRRPHYVFRILLLLITFAFHAFIGLALMSSASITAGEWFTALPRDWGPSLAEDQERGGAIAWGMGDLPVLLMAVAMARQWVRADAREARRTDRQAARDGDAELAAYNDYLSGLAKSDRHR